MHTRDTRDIIGGLALAGLGAFAAIYARQYQFGSLSNMGPGFFPVILGWVLALLGVAIAVSAFFRAGEAVEVKWKACVVVIGSVVIFALALMSLGLVIATAVSVLIASLAERGVGWKFRIALAAGISLVTWAVFVLGLGMLLPVWPQLS